MSAVSESLRALAARHHSGEVPSLHRNGLVAFGLQALASHLHTEQEWLAHPAVLEANPTPDSNGYGGLMVVACVLDNALLTELEESGVTPEDVREFREAGIRDWRVWVAVVRDGIPLEYATELGGLA